MEKQIKKKYKQWKYEIEQRIINYNDDGNIKRDITIIDRKKEKDNKGNWVKYYKYRCNICNFNCEKHWNIRDKQYKNELWINENKLQQKHGCSVCGNKIIVTDINSISFTHPYLVKYFKNIEDTYTHTYSSGDIVYLICPDCNFEIKTRICDFIKSGLSCRKCGDSIPFGEKLLFSVLEQLGVSFQTELNKSTFNWITNGYRYDFYFKLNGESYICEVNGIQHYEQQGRKGSRTLEQEQENDKLKKKLALQNGIEEQNYIVIDCRKSELKWIKEHILESNFNKIFDLSKIEWIQCLEKACNNLIKLACDYKLNNSNLTTPQIGEKMKYSYVTIRKWLKRGNELGWCYYDAEEEKNKTRKTLNKKGKKTEIFKDSISLGIFITVAELIRQSKELFGVKFTKIGIRQVCNGFSKDYKGYTFKYL